MKFRQFLKKSSSIRWLNTQDYWGGISIFFHWLTAFIIFGLFGLGLWMVELGYYDTWYRKAPDLHKSVGILLLVITLLRLIWRRINGNPISLSSHTCKEQYMAIAVHYLLYVLLFSVMISGYLISTADGRPVLVFGWIQIPVNFHGLDKQEDIAGLVHLWLAVSLIGLALLHAIAALKHHFFEKDPTLKRMLGLRILKIK